MMEEREKRITFFFEVSPPFLWEIGMYKSAKMRRFWIGCVAFGWMYLRLDELATEKWNWKEENHFTPNPTHA